MQMGWVALMLDVHPDELKHCLCKTAFLYVHPIRPPEGDYRPDGGRRAQEAWVRVPGRHRTKDAAWDALQGYAGDTSLRGIAKARPNRRAFHG
jgi:hypothetical protein